MKKRVVFEGYVSQGGTTGEHFFVVNGVVIGRFHILRRLGFRHNNLYYLMDAITGSLRPNFDLTTGRIISIGS